VTQNWSFRVPKIGARFGQIGGRFWQCFSAFPYGKNRRPKGRNRCPILPATNKTETYFWAEICSNYLKDAFTINIDLV